MNSWVWQGLRGAPGTCRYCARPRAMHEDDESTWGAGNYCPQARVLYMQIVMDLREERQGRVNGILRRAGTIMGDKLPNQVERMTALVEEMENV